MTASVVVVEVAAPAEAAYAYLAEPRNRPRWQSSLRRVEDVQGHGEEGSQWYDVTAVGARPLMRVTEASPPGRWAETGTWRGVAADLTLDFLPQGDHTRLVATFEVRTPGLLAPLGWVLNRLAPLGVRGDLERAARLIEQEA